MSEWVPPSALQVKTMVLGVLTGHPSRLDQGNWLSNTFTDLWAGFHDPDTSILRIPVGDLLPYSAQDIPVVPEDLERPLCGTRACVAGWGAIVAAPPGTTMSSTTMFFPDGSKRSICDFAEERMELRLSQSGWLFSMERSLFQVIKGLQVLIRDPDADLPGMFAS